MRQNLVRRIASPAYQAWRDSTIFAIGNKKYTRDDLDEMGLGLHVVSIWRLSAGIKAHGLTMPKIVAMNLDGFWDHDGFGDITALMMSHIIADQGYDVMTWIGKPGRTMKGAIANAKAKAKTHPGRSRRGRRAA